MNLQIMMGLPGSGKTSFAYDFIRKEKYHYINLDDVVGYTIKQKCKRIVFRQDCNYVLDGTILTNEDIGLLLRSIPLPILEVTIHFWKENRLLCLKNLKDQKDPEMKKIVRYANLEIPNMEAIRRRRMVRYIDIVQHEIGISFTLRHKTASIGT